MSLPMSQHRSIEFTTVEVTLIYGFQADAQPSDIPADLGRRLGNGGNDTFAIRNGWVSTYHVGASPDHIVQVELPPKGRLRIEAPSGRWKDTRPLKTEEISRVLTLREDGAGTISISLLLRAPAENPLTESHVLRTLMTFPRTVQGEVHPADPQAVQRDVCPTELVGWDLSADLKRLDPAAQSAVADLSIPFKIFAATMGEVFQPDQWQEFADAGPSKAALYGEGFGHCDPQIPYAYVYGEMPEAEYAYYFLDGSEPVQAVRRRRRALTKPIAAILGRWLTDLNIEFASLDYWEQRGLVKHGAFLSQYMNSLVFTTISGIVTISLAPAIGTQEESTRPNSEPTRPGQASASPDPEVWRRSTPIATTHETVLRCLELSRLRWHKALVINRELDLILTRVSTAIRASEILPAIDQFGRVLESLAMHLEDPMGYLWDASVGSRIAGTLHQQVIEDIERDLATKQRQVQALVDHRLTEFQAIDFLSRKR